MNCERCGKELKKGDIYWIDDIAVCYDCFDAEREKA